MIRTMVTAANTMGQIQKELDIIGHNVANVNTHGYKAQQVTFNELLYQQFQNDKGDSRSPRETDLGIRYGVGAKLGQSKTNWKTGNFQQTGQELDFAIQNPKIYFNILKSTEQNDRVTVQDEVYTRKGNFYTQPLGNGQAMLVNEDGYPVLAMGGQVIQFSEDVRSFSLAVGGQLEVALNNGTVERFQLQLTKIERPDLMRRIGDSQLALPDNREVYPIQNILTDLLTIEERQAIRIQQGTLEQSNVQMEREMTELINSQRSYQMNARTVTLADQMLGLVNNIR